MPSEESIALPAMSTCGSSNSDLVDLTEEKSEMLDSSRIVLDVGIAATKATMPSEESIAQPAVATCGSSKPVLVDLTEEKSELLDSSMIKLEEGIAATKATKTANKTDLDDEEEGELLDAEELNCQFCEKKFRTAKENNAHVLKEHFMEINDIWTEMIDSGVYNRYFSFI